MGCAPPWDRMAIRLISDLWAVLSAGVLPVAAQATSGCELKSLALGPRKFRVFTQIRLPAAVRRARHQIFAARLQGHLQARSPKKKHSLSPAHRRPRAAATYNRRMYLAGTNPMCAGRPARSRG
jgi:hypothetical protein